MISLQHLISLKTAFDAIDLDKGGLLDKHEVIRHFLLSNLLSKFEASFDKILNEKMTKKEIIQLFMKIDANSDGNVD